MERASSKLAVIVLGIISFANLALADASTPDKFTVIPANPNGIDPGNLMYEMKPGDKLTDEINIKNYSSQKKDFVLYVTDKYITKDGTTGFNDENETSQLAGLAKFESKTITIGPEETKTVKIMISIPQNQALGDYIGGVAVVTTRPSKDGTNINIAIRYIMGLNIKVTNTPSHIPTINEMKEQLQANSFGPTPYFITSIAIFLLSIGYFIWASRKEKNSKKTP